MSFNPLNSITRNIGYGTGWANFPTVIPDESTAFIFDLRVINKAVSESGGKGVGTTDLGAISYIYDDMKKNGGKVHLPFG
jgi:hypothetical protein